MKPLADTPGSREIGFHVPERYNASRILYDNLAAGRGAKPAIRCNGRTTTYDALCGLADRIGNALAALGLERSERVLLLLDDTPVYPAAVFGAIRAGFVPVLVNTLSPADDIAYFVRDSGARVAFAESDLTGKLRDVEALERIVVVNGKPDKGLPTTAIGLDDFVASASDMLDEADTHRDDMAFWMYSSGSTGRPKGVVHLQHDALYTAWSYARHILDIREGDTVFSVPKIFFAYGYGNSLTFPFSVGATTVLQPGRPQPETILAAIERERPTVFFALPTLYKALLSHPGSADRDLQSLRLCVSAAEPLSPEMFDEWQRRYGLEIVEGLGSTEVLHIYLSNRPGAIKPGASGLRVPGYDIRLTDEEDRTVEGVGTGVMWVRGESTAPFYWNRPEKTADTMRGDWIYTGDRFSRDEDGFYTFAGRADDLIKVSGQWIHPAEVEGCLARHSAVHECVVLGVEDESRLMTLKAYVSLREGVEPSDDLVADMQAFVKKGLLPYKYPRRIVFLPELPKTGTGKIDRRALRVV